MTPENPIALTCKELVELVTEYLSSAMTAEDRARFEEHLRACPPCLEYLAQMRTTIALTGALHAGDSSDDVEALADMFQRWKKK